MNVSLTPELDRFVKDQLACGRYQTASEVIREGLRLLIERRQFFDELETKINRALEDVSAGRTFDPDEARRELAARRSRRRSEA